FYPQINWTGPAPGYVGTEFPLVPFLAAGLYQIFGVQDWFGRCLLVGFFAASVPLDIIANKFLRLPAVNSKVVQSTGDLHHKIVIFFFRISENVFDNATSFNPRNDMLNYNPDT